MYVPNRHPLSFPLPHLPTDTCHFFYRHHPNGCEVVPDCWPNFFVRIPKGGELHIPNVLQVSYVSLLIIHLTQHLIATTPLTMRVSPDSGAGVFYGCPDACRVRGWHGDRQ